MGGACARLGLGESFGGVTAVTRDRARLSQRGLPIEEANMAELLVKAIISGGVIGYDLSIDGIIVPQDEEGTGTVTVEGTCGDRSAHQLIFGFDGAAGATLSVVVTCAGVEVCKLIGASIPQATEPLGGGTKGFRL